MGLNLDRAAPEGDGAPECKEGFSPGLVRAISRLIEGYDREWDNPMDLAREAVRLVGASMEAGAPDCEITPENMKLCIPMSEWPTEPGFSCQCGPATGKPCHCQKPVIVAESEQYVPEWATWYDPKFKSYRHFSNGEWA